MTKAEQKNKKKVRLSIPLSPDVYAKIEKDAEAVGVSMATYAAMIIGNHYRTQQISLDYAKDNIKETFRELFENAFKSKGLDFDKAFDEGADKSAEFAHDVVSEIIKTNNDK